MTLEQQRALALARARVRAGSAKPRGTMADMAVGFGRGLASAGGDILDLVTTASPVGGVMGAVQTAAKVANYFQGGRDTSITGPVTIAGQTARRVAPKPQTRAGRYAEAVGQNVPAAVVPGSRVQRAANVIVPAVVGEAGAQAAEGMGYGETGQTVARVGGNLLGAGLASVRPTNFFQQPDPISSVGVKARQDPAAMRARAQEFRDVGIDPTLVDVMDDSGRGLVRAAANRPTPGQSAANQFAIDRATNLPNRLAMRASEFISDDPRSVDDVTTAVAGRIQRASQPPSATRNVGGLRVSERLNREFDEAKRGVDAAYNAAREAAPDQAIIPRSELPRIASNIREAVRDIAPDDMPSVASKLSALDRLGTVTVRDLFETRQQLSALRQGVPSPQSVAAGRAVQAIDAQIDDVVQRGVVTGDPQVVGLWHQAIAARRDMGQRFQGGDLIETITERTARGGGRANVVAPEDASRALLGASGVSPRANSARDLARIRDQLGPDSPEWRALSDEALGRLMQQDAGRETFGEALTRFSRENPDLAGVLFTPQQRAQVAAAQREIGQAVSQREALATGGAFMRPGGGQSYAGRVGRVDQAAMPEARLAAREAVLAASGNKWRNAPGVADSLRAPEQMIRNEALIGAPQARAFEGAVGLERRALDNAAAIAPSRGSTTFLNLQNEGALQQAAGIGRDVLRRDVGALVGRAVNAWRTRGIPDDQIEQIVRAAIDPNQTDAAIEAIARSLGPEGRVQLLELRNAALAGGAATLPAIAGP